MNIILLEEISRNFIVFCNRTDIAYSRLCRFLHDIAELSGKVELPFTGHQIYLDLQGDAADRGPCEAADDADLIGIICGIDRILFIAEEILQIFLRDIHLFLLLLKDLTGCLSANARDLPLKRPHTGLACVPGDHIADCAVADYELTLFETVGLDLLRNQMILRNMELLVLRVGSDLDDFHTVKERTGDRVGVI